MKGFKIFFALAITIGGIAFIKYITTQAKLLKGICVRSTSLEWREVLVNALQAVLTGGTPQATIPLELEMANNSDIEVEVKEIDFDIFFDGTHIGRVNSQQEAVLGANSVNELEIDVDLDLAGDIGSLALSLIAGDNVIEIVGNIKIKASIYEEYNYPYQLKVQGSDILSESGGDC
tara:strand:- start:3424 stop:3951 length:528 start_codon:yes stop_codon:yes gene_type:complete